MIFITGNSNNATNITYGSFINPYFTGATCRGADIATEGGGIVRIDTGNGSASILGSITASGSLTTGGNTNRGGGAGGSVYMNVGALSGTGSITANGSGNGNGGGGGRIAISYNSLAGNFAYPAYLTNVTAFGGDSTAGGYDGDAGTIYLKDKAKTYGDLIANNTTREANLSAGVTVYGTPLNLPSGTSTALTATELTSSTAFTELGIETNNLVGLFVNPNTAQSTDFPIVAQSGSTITVTGDMTTVATSGNAFKIVAKIDKLYVYNTNLRIYGGGELRITGGTLGGTTGVLRPIEHFVSWIRTLAPTVDVKEL